MKKNITKIVSGGQTGVDQGALETALLLKIPSGGFCPKDRLAENGTIPLKYPLTETNTREYALRTEKNIKHSDGTLILAPSKKLEGGTRLTKYLTNKLKKPCLLLILNDQPFKELFNKWLSDHKINILNIAGPRESKYPGINKKTIEYLTDLLK